MTEEERAAHETLVRQNAMLEQEIVELRDQLEIKTKMLDKYVNLVIRVIEKFV